MSGVGGPPSAPVPSGGDRLAAAVARRESQIVLGLDPDPARLWPGTDPGPAGGPPALPGEAPPHGPLDPASLAGRAIAAHCRAVIEAVAPAVVAVKPQLACFERLGAPGWTALADVIGVAREHGLLVLADAKRGDVPITAAAYGQALMGSTPSPFGAIEGLDADAVTANPLLGVDALDPMVAAARARGGLAFVLVRTSNPGAADLFDAELSDGRPLWERIAALVDEQGREGRGAASGLADVGAVTGATVPEHLARMRELMPRTPFLLPGVGAQGGSVEALAPAFAPGRAGGLVTASRSIVTAHEAADGSPGAAARFEAERLREIAWRLI